MAAPNSRTELSVNARLSVGGILWLQLNLFFNLLTGSLRYSTLLSVLSAVGLITLSLRHPPPPRKSRAHIDPWITRGIWGLFALLAVRIFFDPIRGWDGRSIWFLHSKIIYFARGLTHSADWHLESLQFAHMDYPKLVAVLGAQIASLAGFWNEFLPKGSLILVALPPVLALPTLVRQRAAAAFVAVAFLLVPGELLWSGYMDGLLALYAGTALLALGQGQWALGICLLSVMPNLKNEGLVLAAITLAVLVLRETRSARDFLRRVNRRQLGLFAVALGMSGATWQILRLSWGLQGYLAAGSFVARLLERAGQMTTWRQILEALLDSGRLAQALALLALWAVATRRVGRAARTLLIILAVYVGSVVAVYLGTPFDLEWHLGSSVDRTMLPVVLGVFAAIALELEASLNRKGRTPTIQSE